METVTISRKFQVVIPNAIRRDMGLKPGQKPGDSRRQQNRADSGPTDA